MTRFIAFLTAATLLAGCGTTKAISTKDDSDMVPGLAVENAIKSSEKPPVNTSRSRGFCAKEWVERPVEARVEDFRACYEEELKAHPKLSGRVDASWTIGKDGRVVKVATTGLKEVGACIAAVIKSIRFRPPLIGCEDVSRFPFVFKLD
jgi:hypothetical protein